MTEITLQEVVEQETYLKELTITCKGLRSQNSRNDLKRSPYDDLLRTGKLEDRVEEIRKYYLEVLDKKSKLSYAKRLWVKSVCDVSLMKWIKKYAEPKS